MPPPTVCESEVQMSARVVRTIASLGPGRGTGFSRKPTRPISFITNAFMVGFSFESVFSCDISVCGLPGGLRKYALQLGPRCRTDGGCPAVATASHEAGRVSEHAAWVCLGV